MFISKVKELLNNFRKNPPFIPFSILSGTLYFLTFKCMYILNPANYAWMGSAVDSATHYMGWAYFRHTPLLQYPLGLNPNYSMSVTNTIVYTDSIPLLAFLFKTVNDILPPYFQYFGWWILLCFILQVYFSLKLLNARIDNKYIVYIGSFFFLFCNSFILYLRIAGGQFALLGQWMVIAALYFCMDEKYLFKRWVALILFAVLVHAYIAAMVIALFIADTISRALKNELLPLACFLNSLAVFLVTLMVMHAAGYFTPLSGNMNTDIDLHSHIFSLFDPDGSTHASSLFSIYKQFSPTYVGTGIVLLLAYLLLTKSKFVKPLKELPLVPVIACILMYVYSWGPEIGIWWKTIFTLPRIPVYNEILNFFRNSYRFALPLMYIAIFAALYLFYKNAKPSNVKAAAALILLLSLQFLDHMHDHKLSRRRLEHNRQPMMSNPDAILYDAVSKNAVICEKIVYEDTDFTPAIFPVTAYAARYNIPTNCSRRSRITETYDGFNIDIFKSGNYDRSALYIIKNDDLWSAIKSTVEPSETREDGVFRIYAPQKDLYKTGIQE